MKILIATDNYYPNVNGASYFAQRHVRQLVRHGHEVLVIAPSRTNKDEIYQRDGATVVGIRSMPVERIRVSIPLTGQKTISKAIQDFQPDIVHIQSHFAVGRKVMQAAKRAGIPVIGTNHFMPENLTHYVPVGKSIRKVLNQLMYLHFSRVFNQLEAVTSPTHSAAALLKESGLKLPVTVISNGIDLQFFNKGDELDIRHKYGLDSRPIFLFVGRIDKEKNLDLIIKAFAHSGLDAQLLIVGTGAEMKNLKQLADELGVSSKVHLPGFIPDEDLPSILAMAFCFVMAGNAELQSISTMEAMAAGLPVIGVNAVALPELIHDNENGFLFEHGNVDQLAEAMRKICTDKNLRVKMADKSLEIIQDHDINQVAQKFIDLYQAQLNKKSTS